MSPVQHEHSAGILDRVAAWQNEYECPANFYGVARDLGLSEEELRAALPPLEEAGLLRRVRAAALGGEHDLALI